MSHTTRTPVASDAETSLMALLSACRRRGLKAEPDPAITGGVVVSHHSRVVTLRLMAHRWYRPAPDQTGTAVNMGARGAEDTIARHLTDELLGYL